MAQPKKTKTKTKPVLKRKASPKKTKTQPAAAQNSAPAMTYDLESLVTRLGGPDPAFVKRTFSVATPAVLVERGGRTGSQNILDDVPGFVGSALDIHAALSPEQRGRIRLSPAIYPALLAETLVLRQKKAAHEKIRVDHAAGKANRTATERRAITAGIAKRDSIYDGLKSALGDPAVAELDAVVGRADTADVLADGFESLAAFIDRQHAAGAETAALLADYQVGPECAAEIRADAEKLRKSGTSTSSAARRVSQRGLDLQDGRVLFLIDRVLRAFRAAHRQDATILIPGLVKLAWLFETRPRGKGDTAEEPAAAPATTATPA